MPSRVPKFQANVISWGHVPLASPEIILSGAAKPTGTKLRTSGSWHDVFGAAKITAPSMMSLRVRDIAYALGDLSDVVL